MINALVWQFYAKRLKINNECKEHAGNNLSNLLFLKTPNPSEVPIKLSLQCLNYLAACPPVSVLNAGIRSSSQPTLYVDWDVATAESQQSERGERGYFCGQNVMRIP